MKHLMISTILSFAPCLVHSQNLHGMYQPKADGIVVKQQVACPETESIGQDNHGTADGALLMLTAQASQTQEDKVSFDRHEIGVSFSVGSNTADKTVRDITSEYCERYQMNTNEECFDLIGRSHVMLNLDYHYALSKSVALGFLVGWGFSEEEYSNWSESKDAQEVGGVSHYYLKSGEERSYVLYVAPSLRYIWYRSSGEVCRVYSEVALGAMRQRMVFDYGELQADDIRLMYDSDLRKFRSSALSYDRIRWKPTYQITALGIDCGAGSLRVFSELGYGCRGVWTVVGCRLTL